MTIGDRSYNPNRWDELRNTQRDRQLTSTEQAEYNQIEIAVGRIDAEESARCKPHLKVLRRRHGRVIGSLYGLARGIRAVTGSRGGK